MKKMLIALFVLLFSGNVFSQHYIITYVQKRILDEKSMVDFPEDIKEHKRELVKEEHKFVLKYADGISIYEDVNTNNPFTEKMKKGTNSNVLISPNAFKDPYDLFFYKDLSKNQMLYRFNFANDTFQGVDELLKMDWKITDTIKQVKNYPCRKAVSNWKGYRFTAWFTDAIPIKNGPEKFDGLPGLIVKMEYGQIEITLENVEISEKPFFIEKPKLTSDKKYTMEEARLQIEEEVKKLVEDSGKQDGKTGMVRKVY